MYEYYWGSCLCTDVLNSVCVAAPPAVSMTVVSDLVAVARLSAGTGPSICYSFMWKKWKIDKNGIYFCSTPSHASLRKSWLCASLCAKLSELQEHAAWYVKRGEHRGRQNKSLFLQCRKYLSLCRTPWPYCFPLLVLLQLQRLWLW